MFSQKTTTVTDDSKGSRTVVTTVTKKTTVSSSNMKDFDLLSDLQSAGGTCMTKKVTYSYNSSGGSNEVVEEIVEESNGTPKAIEYHGSQPTEQKKQKPLAKLFGFTSKSKDSNVVPKAEQPVAKKALPAVKPGQFEEDSLKTHNGYRIKHGVPPLKLSKQLCAYAKEWADDLAKRDKFQHRTERQYGENIYMKWSSDPNFMVSGNEAVESWYSEIKDHTFGKEPTSLKSGHFTQVIWKGSTEMGIAWARSKTGKILVVANYNPAGNFIGKFAENVPPPKK